MKEYIKIRVDLNTSIRIKKRTNISMTKIGKEPNIHYDIVLPIESTEWEIIKSICNKVTNPLIFRVKGRNRVPFSHDVGYTIIDHYRKYSEEEIRHANYFHMDLPVRAVLDRSLEQEKLIYNFDNECCHCRYGIQQKGNLLFKKPQFNLKYPLFRVFGRNEIIVYEDIRTAFNQLKVDNVEFLPIETIKKREKIDKWYQLKINSKIHLCFPQTKFGFDFLYRDPKDSAKCPKGHTMGLNLLSELYVKKKDLNGIDIAESHELRGGIQSIQFPTPMIMISRRIYNYFLEYFSKSKIKFEIVNLENN